MKLKVFNGLTEGMQACLFVPKQEFSHPEEMKFIVVIIIDELPWYYIGYGETEESALQDAINEVLRHSKEISKKIPTIVSLLQKTL